MSKIIEANKSAKLALRSEKLSLLDKSANVGISIEPLKSILGTGR